MAGMSNLIWVWHQGCVWPRGIVWAWSGWSRPIFGRDALLQRSASENGAHCRPVLCFLQAALWASSKQPLGPDQARGPWIWHPHLWLYIVAKIVLTTVNYCSCLQLECNWRLVSIIQWPVLKLWGERLEPTETGSLPKGYVLNKGT